MTASHTTRSMPPDERALLNIFETVPGTVGLLLDDDGDPFAAWHLGYRDVEYGYAFTTMLEAEGHRLTKTATNPLVWLYGATAPIWEGNEVPVYEITRDGLVDLALTPDGQTPRTGAEITAVLHAAGPGRFFAIGEHEHQFPALRTRNDAGDWVGSGCGGDLQFDGPYPHTDPVQRAEFVEETGGYDTPFFTGAWWSSPQVASVIAVGIVPGPEGEEAVAEDVTELPDEEEIQRVIDEQRAVFRSMLG